MHRVAICNLIPLKFAALSSERAFNAKHVRATLVSPLNVIRRLRVLTAHAYGYANKTQNQVIPLKAEVKYAGRRSYSEIG